MAFAIGVAWTLFSACSDENTIIDARSPNQTPGASNESAGTEGEPGSPSEAVPLGTTSQPTFYEDVGPIFSAKCVGCHQEGGIAPFALNDYEAARARGGQIADYTENRVMPPFGIQTGGECGSFDESRALSEEEIALIGRWGRGDRAEGTAVPMPPPVLPTLEGATEFTAPDFTPQIAGTELAQFDEYRCFLIEPGQAELSFITGYNVTPGNARIVHHVLGFLVDPTQATQDGRTNAEVMDALHAEDPNPERDGWSCFGAAGDGVEVESVPVTWGPGQGVVNYAGGVGVPFAPGRQIVLQVHYNLADPSNMGQSDQTRVRLRLEPTVERPAAFLLEDPLLDSLFDGSPVTLAPGEESVQFVWEKGGEEMGIPPGVEAQIVSIIPHMHERGRKYTFEVDNGSGYQCQGYVPRWDFNWQRMYDYTAPIAFDSNTRVRVTCDYDTVGLTEAVVPGWGTRNEMCLASIVLALPAAAP